MSAVLRFNQKQVMEQCCRCAVIFTVPECFQEQRRADEQMFYCPSGHPQHYTESDATKLKRELISRDADVEKERQRSQLLREQVAMKDRELERIKTRVSKIDSDEECGQAVVENMFLKEKIKKLEAEKSALEFALEQNNDTKLEDACSVICAHLGVTNDTR